MIDHLIRAADEAAVIDLVASIYPEWIVTLGGARRVIPNVSPGGAFATRVGLAPPVYGEPDPETGEAPLITPAVYAEGTYLWIGLPALDEALRDLSDDACRLIADREAASIIYTAPDMTPELLASAWLDPVISGSNYPFGGGV